jgi:hypothetical protein
MSYRDCLPHSHIEMWIIRIAFCVFVFFTGFCGGLLYTQNNFERGMTFMQKAYTTPGLVERVVVKNAHDR